jgi:hypothetical protein
MHIPAEQGIVLGNQDCVVIHDQQISGSLQPVLEVAKRSRWRSLELTGRQKMPAV